MKGDIKKAKKKIDVVNDLKITIAGMRVMSNAKTPEGVMVVSPADGDRLVKMVDDASRKKAEQAIKDDKEGK